MDEQRKWSFEIESAPGEDAVKILEMTTKELEQYINLLDEIAAGFERMDSNFERSSALGEMLSNSIARYREIVRERRSPSAQRTSLLSCFRRLPRPPHPSATTTLIGQQPAALRRDCPPAKKFMTL